MFFLSPFFSPHLPIRTLLLVAVIGSGHLTASGLLSQAATSVLLQGRVEDGDDGHALVSGGVTIRKLTGGEPAREIRILDGRFAVELPPGRYVLEIWSPGFQRLRSDPVAVRPGMEDLEFALSRVRELQGRVLDERGKPISGATIDALRSGDDNLITVLSDGDGFFRLPGTTEETAYVLQVRHPQFVVPEPVEVWLPDADRVEIVLESHRELPGGSLWGQVRARDGRPLAGVRVQLDKGLPGAERPICESGPDGWYSFPEIDAGNYSVRFAHPGFSESAGDLARVKISAGQVARVDFQFSGSESLRGRVVDDAGEPVAGVQISLLGVVDKGEDSAKLEASARARFYSSTSSSQGTFDFRGVPPGPYELIVRSPAGIYQERRIPIRIPEDNDIFLELKRGLSVQVLVVDAAGEAIVSYDLTIQDASGSGGIRSRRVDSPGPVVLKGLAGTEYEITVTLEDGRQYSAVINVASASSLVARVEPDQARLLIDASKR